VCMYVCVYICMYVCIYVCVYIYIYIYIMKEVEWVCHVARRAQKECMHGFGGEKLKEGDGL